MLRTLLSICGEPFVFCCFKEGIYTSLEIGVCTPPTTVRSNSVCCSAANSLILSISLAAHYTCSSPVFERCIHASLAFVVNVCEGFPRPQSIVMGLSVVLQITATLFVKKCLTVFTISAKVVISRLCHFCQSASSVLEGHHYQMH